MCGGGEPEDINHHMWADVGDSRNVNVGKRGCLTLKNGKRGHSFAKSP